MESGIEQHNQSLILIIKFKISIFQIYNNFIKFIKMLSKMHTFLYI